MQVKDVDFATPATLDYADGKVNFEDRRTFDRAENAGIFSVVFLVIAGTIWLACLLYLIHHWEPEVVAGMAGGTFLAITLAATILGVYVYSVFRAAAFWRGVIICILGLLVACGIAAGGALMLAWLL